MTNNLKKELIQFQPRKDVWGQIWAGAGVDLVVMSVALKMGDSQSCSKLPPPLEMHRHALSSQLSLSAKEIDSNLTKLQAFSALVHLQMQSRLDSDTPRFRNAFR
uniref:Uncharacterized protein n=1 Tax=Rhodnius prolixus TaxID=13249 RepID=T1I6A6_RHOPR